MRISKGVLNDYSKGNFSGCIRVRPDAQKTEAYQSNKNLLLTDTARMNSKPQLVIDADDVKCSHGASVGQLDEEAMFYLRSRGIGTEEAKMMLMFGFAHDIISKVKIEALRDQIDRMVDKRLRVKLQYVTIVQWHVINKIYNLVMFDINKIRADFPILKEKIYGKDLVYLDSGATSQRPQAVIDRMNEYYLKYNSNVHRGVYYLSNKCTDANEEARILVRDFINAKSVQEVIFTRGTTESCNLVAYSFGEAFIHQGDEIVITEMEHHANIVPWQMLCERKGAVLKVIPFKDNGDLDLTDIDTIFTDKVKILGLAYISNVLGTINPVKQLIDKAHSVGAKVLLDGAQAVQHIKIDVQALDCDFLVFSAHKLYGPTGVGILYGKQELLEQMPPWQGGGEMIKEVRFEKTTYNELPFKFEAGTPDFIGIIGLGEAIKYINSIGIDNIAEYEHDVLNYAMHKMKSIEGMRIFGESEHKSSVISFLVGDIHHFDMGTMLDQLGIAVRTGHMCADPVIRHYSITGVVRASFGMYNTKDEVDVLCNAINKVKMLFA